MADFTNAQKLAAIVSEWARPALSQIASSKISNLQWVRTLQDGIVGLGLAGSNYDIAQDLQPLLQPAINAIIEPMLADSFSKIPDAAIPQMARDIVEELTRKGSMTLLDGLIVLDQTDVEQLRNLVGRNLPYDSNEHYKIIKDDEQQ